MTNQIINLAKIRLHIDTQLSNPSVLADLISTTFKGFEVQTAKRAMLEGMMRGFTFDDFLKKNIYAIPFNGGYSLVTSIDYVRKIGMRSGVVGKTAPIFEENDGKVVSCTITIKKATGDIVGDFSDTVFFNEYTTGRNLWISKPHTMIAKVAEMHALRMACPEELSQMYIEEDMEKESIVIDNLEEEVKLKVIGAKTLEELKTVYKENEGLGKDFAKLVTNKKLELSANIK